jgi:hypothetical protein
VDDIGRWRHVDALGAGNGAIERHLSSPSQRCRPCAGRHRPALIGFRVRLRDIRSEVHRLS